MERWAKNRLRDFFGRKVYRMKALGAILKRLSRNSGNTSLKHFLHNNIQNLLRHEQVCLMRICCKKYFSDHRVQ